jgi:hypothetical protein
MIARLKDVPARREDVTPTLAPPENRPVNRALAGLALVLLPASAAAAPKADPARYGWHTDLGAATTEAKRTGRPIFLVFRCEP